MNFTDEQKNFLNFTSETSLKINSLSEKKAYDFNFDRIFQSNTTQSEMFETAAKDIIDSVLNGYNGTIFAYGQTSSGKTFTMTGKLDDETLKGIIPRMAEYVFSQVSSADENIVYTIKASMIEIYMEKIRDLIVTENSNLPIRQNKNKEFYIENLSEHFVSNEKDIYDLLNKGNENRAVAFTKMNANSSRSHSIFILSIYQNNNATLEKKAGKLYLVDLAGSEKATKTGAEGQTLDEAKAINLSLTNLGMVINALTDGKSKFIPYRQSKLTWILSESLGGNAKTALVIACSPSPYNESETLSTLRFGERAKSIKNKPKVNKELTVDELKRQISKLEEQVREKDTKIKEFENFLKSKGLEMKSEEKVEVGEKTIPKEGEVVINNKEIEEMKNQIIQLEGQLQCEEFERMNIQTEYDELQEDINKLNEKNTLKEKQLEQFEQKQTYWEEQENKLTKKIEELEQELKTLKEQLITKKGTILTMTEIYNQMKKYTHSLNSFDKISLDASHYKEIERETMKIMDMLKSISNLDFMLKNNNDSNFNLVQIDPHVVDITIENKEKLILPNKAEENKKAKEQLSIYEICIRQRDETIKRLQEKIKIFNETKNSFSDDEQKLVSQLLIYQNNFNYISIVNLKLQSQINEKSNLIKYAEMKNKMKNQKMAMMIKEIKGLKHLLKMREERLMKYEKSHLSEISEKNSRISSRQQSFNLDNDKPNVDTNLSTKLNENKTPIKEETNEGNTKMSVLSVNEKEDEIIKKVKEKIRNIEIKDKGGNKEIDNNTEVKEDNKIEQNLEKKEKIENDIIDDKVDNLERDNFTEIKEDNKVEEKTENNETKEKIKNQENCNSSGIKEDNKIEENKEKKKKKTQKKII